MEKGNLNFQIEEVIRTNRKTIALQVLDDGKLIIKAPINIDQSKIIDVIYRYRKWIEQKQNDLKLRDPKFTSKEFVNGEGFLYLGKYYKLSIVEEQDVPLKFDNGFFLSKDFLPKAKETFIEWYKAEALRKISERVQWYANIGGFVYSKVKISNAEKRWASCSHNGNLNFSWRLIMAPLSVIDYVVVHELSHLTEKSHGKIFWNRVKILMPDYEKHKDSLKRFGYLLRL